MTSVDVSTNSSAIDTGVQNQLGDESETINVRLLSATDTTVNTSFATSATYSIAFNAHDHMYMTGQQATSAMSKLLLEAANNGSLSSSIHDYAGYIGVLATATVYSSSFIDARISMICPCVTNISAFIDVVSVCICNSNVILSH